MTPSSTIFARSAAKAAAAAGVYLLTSGGAAALTTNGKDTPMIAADEQLFRELLVVALEALAQGRQGAAQDAIAELRALTEA
jgi:hypothetical protein